MPYSDPTKRREYLKAYCKRNAERARERAAAWRSADPKRARESEKAARAKNPELYREHARNVQRRRVPPAKPRLPTIIKKAKHRADVVARKARKLKATPLWADRQAIASIYLDARRRGLHVDHVVPLRSKLVCGLHCEANLLAIPKTDNARKGNRHWPYMP